MLTCRGPTSGAGSAFRDAERVVARLDVFAGGSEALLAMLAEWRARAVRVAKLSVALAMPLLMLFLAVLCGQ